MVTKSKARDETAQIEERLHALEQQRQRASDAILEAKNEASEIKKRQDELAVAVISEEAAAVSEMGELEDALLTATRRASVARSALGQLEAEISQAKEDLAEAERQEHLRRFEELARQFI